MHMPNFSAIRHRALTIPTKSSLADHHARYRRSIPLSRATLFLVILQRFDIAFLVYTIRVYICFVGPKEMIILVGYD